MWLKILKGVYVAAKAVGLDKKVKSWVKSKLNKVADKYVKKIVDLTTFYDEIEQ